MAYLFGDPAECAFVRVPKTGSTSIIRGLLKPRYGKAVSIVDGPAPEEWGVKSFAFVRHPADRLASTLAMFRRKLKAHSLSVEDVLEVVRDDRIQPLRDSRLGKLKLHAIPQVSQYFGLRSVGKIYRYENFEQSWGNLCDFLGIDEPLILHANKTDNRVLLSSADENLVRKFYSEDLEVFGYK